MSLLNSVLRVSHRQPVPEQAPPARPGPARHSARDLSHSTGHDNGDGVLHGQSSVSAQYRAVGPLPDKAVQLAELGESWFNSFENSHALDDLQRAIDAQERAVELMHDDHPARITALAELGLYLWYCFKRLGKLDDLKRAIALQTYSIDHTPENDPDYARRLAALADSLRSRYQHLGELHDLRDSIAESKAALSLTPEDHPDRPRQLSNLGRSFNLLFGRLGKIHALEEAIATHRRAVGLTPEGHPDLHWWLDGLASSLRNRFERLGDIRDLEEAIATGRESVKLTPEGHPELPVRLQNLTISLQCRFERLGEIRDLEDGITADSLAVNLTPNGNPNRALGLNNIAWKTYLRFQHLGELKDLESAIDMQCSAIELLSDDHPSRPLYVDNLAVSLRARFECLGKVDDIHRAISLHQLAVDLTPDDRDPRKSERLHNFAVSLRTWSNVSGTDLDLEKAIATHWLVLHLTPQDDPREAYRLYECGLSLRARFERRQSKSHFNASFNEFMKAAVRSLGNPSVRLKSAQQCVLLLSEYPDFGSAELLLAAHSRIIEMFPQLVWLGYSIERRFEESAKLGELINAAIHAFVSSHSKYQAIEWMEIGRSLVWSQIYSLREPLDELETQYPELAAHLRRISWALQHTSAVSDNAGRALTQPDDGNLGGSSQPHRTLSMTSFGAAADHHRSLAIEYESVLKDVREKPGFESFLRPPRLEDRLPSIEALDGPVVFVNVHSSSCDALVLLPNGGVRHVVLANLQSSHLKNLRVIWTRFLQSPELRTRGAVSADRLLTTDRFSMIASVLGKLWDWIVEPILQALGFMNGPSLKRHPHVTWCPTGPLTQLPLHAAGIYDATQVEQPRVFDFVVSSYTPSLSALLRCRAKLSAQCLEPNVLVVAQPATPTYAPLPHTRHEGERVGKVLSNRAPTVLMDQEATIKHTLTEMQSNSWIHLACHGFQDPKNPTRSAFALYNGSLTLADLMATTTKDAELAFLSACQTAVGDEKIPEESAHLAAGMLAAGFKGVIATMWSILDQDAPILVQAYYESLLRLRGAGSVRTEGYTEAAYALHEAMEVLRVHVGEQNFVRWAPFVHFGV